MAFMLTLTFESYLKITLLFFVTYIIRFYYKYFTRQSPLPGPLPLPLIGNLHQMGSDPAKFAQRLQAKYGDIWEVYMGSERNIYLGRADLIEKMMKPSAKFNFFNRGSRNDGFTELGLQTRGIVFNHDVASWRLNRKILTQSIVSHDFLTQIITESQKLLIDAKSYWEKLGPNTELDLTQWMFRYTTDITLKSTTGNRINSLRNYYNSIAPKSQKIELSEGKSLVESEIFLKRIMDWMSGLQYFFFFPQFIRYYVLGFRHYTHKCLKNDQALKGIISDIIEERREEIKNTPEKLDANILTTLLTTNIEDDPNGEHSRLLTDAEISADILEVFLAGIDTTANSISFIVYFISQYPEVKSRLLQEIKQIFGTDSLTHRQITLEDLDKLVYCEAIIKETARLVPVTPLVFKEISRDDEIAGCKFNAGTMFFANIQGIHCHNSHWSNPKKFDPDRFMKNSESETKIEKNTFLPFGGGIRICPGRFMAMTEMKIVLITLFTAYEIELVNPKKPLEYSYRIVNQCKELKVYLRPKANQ
ncbi:hypothetical protein G9A89_017869 [Geosiphon pyriformis]|nr:hypothetical protein G9A89_017869 [Geosiphon pyriformis]